MRLLTLNNICFPEKCPLQHRRTWKRPLLRGPSFKNYNTKQDKSQMRWVFIRVFFNNVRHFRFFTPTSFWIVYFLNLRVITLKCCLSLILKRYFIENKEESLIVSRWMAFSKENRKYKFGFPTYWLHFREKVELLSTTFL